MYYLTVSETNKQMNILLGDFTIVHSLFFLTDFNTCSFIMYLRNSKKK